MGPAQRSPVDGPIPWCVSSHLNGPLTVREGPDKGDHVVGEDSQKGKSEQKILDLEKVLEDPTCQRLFR